MLKYLLSFSVLLFVFEAQADDPHYQCLSGLKDIEKQYVQGSAVEQIKFEDEQGRQMIGNYNQQNQMITIPKRIDNRNGFMIYRPNQSYFVAVPNSMAQLDQEVSVSFELDRIVRCNTFERDTNVATSGPAGESLDRMVMRQTARVTGNYGMQMGSVSSRNDCQNSQRLQANTMQSAETVNAITDAILQEVDNQMSFQTSSAGGFLNSNPPVNVPLELKKQKFEEFRQGLVNCIEGLPLSEKRSELAGKLFELDRQGVSLGYVEARTSDRPVLEAGAITVD